jgi:hypothetical protein
MRLLLTTLAALAALAAVRPTIAEDCATPAPACGSLSCCAHCGRNCPCQRAVCQVVCEKVKIKKPCFCVETEEFCIPRPQFPCCHSHCSACATGHCCGCCGSLLNHLVALTHDRCIVPPKCGPVHCRKVLTVKENIVEEPAYKCQVKYLCADCCAATGATKVEGEAKPAAEPLQPAPLPPTPSAAPTPPTPPPAPQPSRQGFLPQLTPWLD